MKLIKSTSDIVPGKTVYHIFYHLSPYVNNPSVGTVVRKGQKISRYATREEIIRDDRVRKLGKGSMPPHVHWEIVGIPDDIVRKESEPWSVKTGNPKYYYDPLVYLKTGKLVNRRAQREGYPIKLEPKLS